MSTVIDSPSIPRRQVWSAVASMAMCAAMLIASEFMPVSLLTPIASDLRASVGMAGQAISISGLFAVVTRQLIPCITSRLLSVAADVLHLACEQRSTPERTLLLFAGILKGCTCGADWASRIFLKTCEKGKLNGYALSSFDVANRHRFLRVSMHDRVFVRGAGRASERTCGYSGAVHCRIDIG